MSSSLQVSFLGLGIMGSRMAANLLQAGQSLTVYNRSEGPAVALAAAGAQVAPSPAAAAQGADILFTMLAHPQAVEAVMLGPEGALTRLRPGALWVDCTTVNPSFARQMAAAAQANGLRYMDAPVAGTKPQAKAGTLAFFVGGEQADLEKIHPLLMHMGQMVLPLGPAGQGSAYKMLINSLLAQAMAAFSEAVALGEKLGLDRSFLLQNLPKAPVCAPFLATKAGKLLQEDTDTQFPLELMYKDLHLAALSAYEAGLPLPLTATVKEQYAAAVQAGRGREDFSAILNFMADPGK